MIEDIRNSKNLSVYLEQLEEVKARLSFVSAYSNEEKDRFVIESYALQIRKLIELTAFSLIAIHRIRYEDYREKVGKDFRNDWNGRDIITNIMSLNPDMFFRAAEKGFNIQDDGTKQVQLKPEKDCYKLKRLAKLHSRCGGVLHVENPWKKSSKVEQFHNELPSIIRKLSNTLQDHVILVNHWDSNESTVLLFTLGSRGEKPTYALAQAPGNFAFESA
ncbi:hypothetical protein [Salinivibrio costicola]|uniref:HEPN AbiU2-like domain-containing protein n=1 Tax=Salinivibrio costicola TaxID=51367 RepID=A0ABX6K826_SALCS|nr:hypothetical protein [Salinivibrio costicola]QIR07676.1 hypothetical protein HBA18_14815 [Salinivibrio costicola]